MSNINSTSLTSLPIELVNRTCSYLDQPEWAALRLSCRSLYAKSLDAFADRYFKSICFIATSEGVRQLEELAKSETLRVRVRQLWMIPTVFEGRHGRSFDEFKDSDYSSPKPRFGHFSRSHFGRRKPEVTDDTLFAEYAIYQAIEADNVALLESNTFGSRLHTCFASFTNLESVGLKHYATDFLLDVRQTEFRCLGLHKLRDQVEYVQHSRGFRLLQTPEAGKVNSLALSRVLQGLNESNSKIRALNTCGPNFCGSTSPHLPLTQEQYDSLLLKLGDLEHLHMCICYDKEDVESTPNPNTYIDLLICVAPRLKMLVFSQWYRRPRYMPECYFSDLSQSIRFTQLKELHLHWIQIELESFKSFLNTTKGTLDSLSLELVTLSTKISPSTNYEPNSWRHVWEFLGAELSLKTFYMGNIGHGNPDDWRSNFKVMIQGPDELAEPTYSATFNADITSLCFNDWIRQLKPISTDRQELFRRKCPGLQPNMPPKLLNSF